MAEHPLVRDDLYLIQDFILTKAALFLARDAAASEFRFELDTVRVLSAHKWWDRNAFLLDYTLARYIAALEAVPPSDGDASEADGFVRDFTDAVRIEQFEGARTKWMSSRPDGEPATQLLPSTLALFERLLRLKKNRAIGTAADFLPGPYTPSA